MLSYQPVIFRRKIYMKRINYFFCIFILSLSINVLKAQDIHFSQVNETPLFLSPANTGFFNGYVRAVANYKNQWAAMNNAFQTMALSVDGGLFRSKKRKAFMGLGLTIFSDKAGVAKIRKTTIQLNASGLVKIGRRSALSAGVAFGSASSNANYDKLTYASQFNGNALDPGIVSGEIPFRQFTTLDLGTGLAYEFSKVKYDQDHDDVSSFKLAFGAYHLNKPAQEFGAGSSYRLPVRFAYSFTSNFDLEDTKFTVNPTVVYQTQGSLQELLLGSYVKYRMSTGTKVTGQRTQNAIGGGLFYRRKDAIIAKFIFDMGDYSVGIAYDFNVSSYRNASRGFGGPEISLRYNMLASSLFESKREFR
jgi:type IX secretion system PorP/SprF family membrane protein